ncbi:MAG: ATP-binding cassette domain-containing protein [Cyclobacteriaceae bacterium]
MSKHELEVDSVQVNFDNRAILSDVYLKCETGDIVGILGRNGCGKSTLLKIIFGSQSTFDKNVRIDKVPYAKAFANKDLIAYLPQHDFLPANAKVENVFKIYFPNKEKREWIFSQERVSELLDKRVRELSGGELKYVSLYLLIHLNVKFVLINEPFSGVEPLYKEKIAALIKENRHNKGFIITDHDYRNIISTSDRIILIDNGVCRPISELKELEAYNYVPPGTF